MRPVPYGKDLIVPRPPSVSENMKECDAESETDAISEDGRGDVYKPEDDLTPQTVVRLNWMI